MKRLICGLLCLALAVLPANSAGILLLAKSSGVTFSLTYPSGSSSANDSVGGTNISYGTPDIGVADPNRYVVVAIMARIGATQTVASVSVNSQPAIQVPGAAAIGGTALVTDIWYYGPVTTGTTATVSVTYGSATIVSGISVYRLITATPTPQDGQHNSGTTIQGSNPLSKSVTVPVGGGMIGSFGYIPTSNGGVQTWSGGTVVKDYDTNIALTGRYVSTAHDVGSSGLITYIVTPSLANANTAALSLAAWKP